MKNQKKTHKVGAPRYDEAQIKKIAAFLRDGHTNMEAKVKFGCSAHYAGDVRAKFKIPFPAKSKPTPPKRPAAKAAKKSAKKPSSANSLL